MPSLFQSTNHRVAQLAARRVPPAEFWAYVRRVVPDQPPSGLCELCAACHGAIGAQPNPSMSDEEG